MMITATLALLVLAMPWTTESYPLGAGRCPAGEAAVSGAHLQAGKEITTGTLSEGGFTVSLNGVALEEAPEFRVGQEDTITISSNMPFKGFLIRVAPPQGIVVDVRDAIYPVSSNDTDTQVADVACVQVEQVGGLTHTTNSEKTQVSGTLSVDAAISGLMVDITVVGVNNAQQSTYWHSSFEIKPEGPFGTPVPSYVPTSIMTWNPTPSPSLSPSPDTATSIDVDEEESSEQPGSEDTVSSARSLFSMAVLVASWTAVGTWTLL